MNWQTSVKEFVACLADFKYRNRGGDTALESWKLVLPVKPVLKFAENWTGECVECLLWE